MLDKIFYTSYFWQQCFCEQSVTHSHEGNTDKVIDLPNLIQKFFGLLSLLFLEGRDICFFLPRKIHATQFLPKQRRTKLMYLQKVAWLPTWVKAI